MPALNDPARADHGTSPDTAHGRPAGSEGQTKALAREHVHVHSGGQVVVGVVEAPGGGVQPKSEDQPHASEIAHADFKPAGMHGKEWSNYFSLGMHDFVAGREERAELFGSDFQAEPALGHLHGDCTQKIAFADVHAAMAQDRIGGCEMEIEVRQHEMV